MATVTRTTNPLPFEHFEPKRFEDLVRQLAYEFRRWQQLEATGRSGSDDGFDARGWEIVGDQEEIPQPIDGDDELLPDRSQTRQWLIQCKREKTIGPTKIARYFDEISSDELTNLYGIVFAAACDFSKKTRDTLREKCRAAGIAECHIWGKGEIEDMLFQPKNDGLLFAYFGISLRVRRRSLRTELRSRLAMKRKLERTFGGGNFIGRPALFLDPRDTDYPYLPDGVVWNDAPWRAKILTEFHPLGIIVQLRRYSAYLDQDSVHWDSASAFNETLGPWQFPWATDEDERAYQRTLSEVAEVRGCFPEGCSATLTISGLLTFCRIIDVDPDGDPMWRFPIIYVEYENGEFLFPISVMEVTSHSVMRKPDPSGPSEMVHVPRQLVLDDFATNRVEMFPAHLRTSSV